jgi:predicted nucleic acid-binding protein
VLGSLTTPGPAFARELEDPRTPEVVRAWLKRPPAWLAVREVHVAPDLELDELDAGERNAIQLAIDEDADLLLQTCCCRLVAADLLLMDERAGVAMARQRGLIVSGTLAWIIHVSDDKSFLWLQDRVGQALEAAIGAPG